MLQIRNMIVVVNDCVAKYGARSTVNILYILFVIKSSEVLFIYGIEHFKNNNNR